MKRIVFLLLFFVCMSCCKLDFGLCPCVSHAYYHFSYENHAWGSVHSGWMIDENGWIRAYKNPEKWNYPDSSGYISRYHLEENLSFCDSVVGRVSLREMSYYNVFVYSASRGLLSKPEQHGADMGEQTYSCYWYDRSKDRYRHVMLNEYGDWVRYNTDDSAMKIYSWLRELVTN